MLCALSATAPPPANLFSSTLRPTTFTFPACRIPASPGRADWGRAGDAILSFDWSVGRVLTALDSLGLAENTLVILSSDNGPVVDDGYRDGARELLGAHKPGGDFRGGKYSIYEAGTRVPCIVRWPGAVPAGVVTDALAGQWDWFARWPRAGRDTARRGAPTAKSISPHGSGAGRARAVLAYQSNNENVTVTDGRWKYVPPFTGPRYAWGTGIMSWATVPVTSCTTCRPIPKSGATSPPNTPPWSNACAESCEN